MAKLQHISYGNQQSITAIPFCILLHKHVRVWVNGTGQRVGRDRVRVSSQGVAITGYAPSRYILISLYMFIHERFLGRGISCRWPLNGRAKLVSD